MTGLLFAGYYAAFFFAQIGPCHEAVVVFNGKQWDVLRAPLIIQRDWPIYALYMLLIAALLAASLIDAELFIIPIEIPWLIAAIGVVAHAFIPTSVAGSLGVNWPGASTAAGGAIGLVISIVMFRAGWITQSFPRGEPLLEVDREEIAQKIEQAKSEGKTLDFEEDLPPHYTRRQIRGEIGKEMLFLLPPLIGAAIAVVVFVSPARQAWLERQLSQQWLSGILGAILGALIGAVVVWLTRVIGTLVFGRVAMGLGDVHLMFGVGAVIGAGAATIAFFIAPFFGILIAIWMLITGKRRELPYGPYLSLATAFVMLFYCPIADYLTPGVYGLIEIVRARLGR